MPNWNLAINETVTLAGSSYNRTGSVPADNGAGSEPSGGVAAAESGTLSTRTDADTGVLTITGTAITTGAVIDVFWSGGSRRGMTVGTVSGGDTVPIDGGTGDDLPAQDTAMTAAVPHEEVVSVVGNNAVWALAYWAPQPTDGDAYVVFTQADDTVIVAYQLSAGVPSNSWDGADVATNPFAGVTVGKVKFSHGETTARTMGGFVGYS